MRVPVSVLDRIRDGLHGLSKADAKSPTSSLPISIGRRGSQSRNWPKRLKPASPPFSALRVVLVARASPDLKRRVSQDVAIERMFVFPSHDSPPRTAEEVAMKVYDASAQALAYAFSQRDPSALENAALAIVAAPRVFCFGVGGSSANIATEAENRLFRYDIHATAIADPYRQRLASGLCEPEDAVLIFSVTGQPRSLVDSAEAARELGATIISVTRPNSALAKASSIVLALNIPDHERHFQIPHRSRYGQLFVLDCLATLVATQKLVNSAPKLRRLRAMLIELHGPTDQQPIGD